MAKLPKHVLEEKWLDIAYSSNTWNVGNDWLYKLCKRYPTHKNVGEVAAKIWLIGRAYSVAVERGVSGKGGGEKYVEDLAVDFVKQQADQYLTSLPSKRALFSKNLDLVSKTHKAIEAIFANKHLSRVSLTSKYLHFHRPNLFPIYDSRAAAAITKVTPEYQFSNYALQPVEVSSRYDIFCARCAWLVDEMKKRRSNKTPTLRQLDTMLLEIYRDIVKK